MALLVDSQDKRTKAALHSQIGQIRESMGDLAEALIQYSASLALNEEIGSPEGTGMALLQLSRLDLTNGAVEKAQLGARRALAEFDRSANGEGIASATVLLGRVELKRNNLAEARVLLIEALEQYGETGNAAAEAWCRKYLGDVLVASKLVEEAEAQHRRSQDLADSLGIADLQSLFAD